MSLPKKDLIKILLEYNYISKEDLNSAIRETGEEFPLDNLLQNKVIDGTIIGNAVSEHFKIKFFDTNSKYIRPTRELYSFLDENFINSKRCVVVGVEGKKIYVGTTEPDTEKEITTALKPNIPEYEIIVGYIKDEDFENILTKFKSTIQSKLSSIVEGGKIVVKDLLTEIISDAVNIKASDIHFDPEENEVVVRYRVDGVLTKVVEFSQAVYENVLNRIKVLAKLRIDEHYKSQDGAIRTAIAGSDYDLRVSIAPTVGGEKVVLRILSLYVKNYSLEDLGFDEKDIELIKKSLGKSFGMVLAVGPTGSGKTTTLYSLMKILNKPNVNIMTIEDPVEYKIPSVNQIQVNRDMQIDFAKGLRSIVRQDPNVILVGEIRDRETAEIGINAALIGHLLLSSFHANDAATTIPRLIDMGIEPFLLSSTLNLIIAQRLVRKICTNCKQSKEVDLLDLKKQIKKADTYFNTNTCTLYYGKGCEKCGRTGYRGRVAIFEIIYNTSEMQDLILNSPSAQQVSELARSQGAVSMFEDGIKKVKQGITTIEELLRVVDDGKGSKEVYKT